MQIYSKSCSTPPGSLWVLDYHFYKYAYPSGSSCTTIFTYYANPSRSSCTTILNLLCEPFRVELHNHFELIMRTLQGHSRQVKPPCLESKMESVYWISVLSGRYVRPVREYYLGTPIDSFSLKQLNLILAKLPLHIYRASFH